MCPKNKLVPEVQWLNFPEYNILYYYIILYYIYVNCTSLRTDQQCCLIPSSPGKPFQRIIITCKSYYTPADFHGTVFLLHSVISADSDKWNLRFVKVEIALLHKITNTRVLLLEFVHFCEIHVSSLHSLAGHEQILC